MSNRHRKPTAAELTRRTYRHVLSTEALLKSHCKTLAEHCERLMREKELLQARDTSG